MIRAICWKEWREQRFFGALLTTVGVAMLYAVGLLADGGFGSRNAMMFQSLTILAMSITIGAVCGAMLLAGERENATQWYLDLLPTSRWRIWRAKVLFGFVFTTAQCLILILGGWMLDAFGRSNRVMILIALVSVWVSFLAGVCGSAISRTVLGGAGYGILMLTCCWTAAYILTIPFLENGIALVWIILGVSLSTIPLVWTTWHFTKPDRERRASADFWAGANEPIRWGLLALFWLVYRQSRGTFLALALFAALLGSALVPLQAFTIMGWVVASGILGILWGVTIFADEHVYGAARFWGERRLPSTRLWSVKVGMHALGLLVSLFVMMIPLVVRFSAQNGSLAPQERNLTGISLLFQSLFLNIIEGDSLLWLVVPPIYAFTVGQLVGLLFHKPLVAAVVSLLTAGPLIAVWVPSMILGGLHTWQWLIPPVIIMITGRWLMHRWASERLASRRAVTILSCGVSLSLSTIIAGLVYRAMEYPDLPDALVDSGIEERLPTVDANQGGRLVKQACEQFERQMVGTRISTTTANQMREVLSRGWTNTPEDRELLASVQEWMKDAEWVQTLREARRYPLGVVEDPRLTTTLTPYRSASALLSIMPIMAIASLDEVQRGDVRAFADRLELGLATLRQFRQFAPPTGEQLIPILEGVWTSATLRFFEMPQCTLAEVNRVSDLWRDYCSVPIPWGESRWIGLLIERTTLNQPQVWLNPRLFTSNRSISVDEPIDSFVTFGWNVPWERIRRNRQVRLLSQPDSVQESWSGTPISPWLRLVRLQIRELNAVVPSQSSMEQRLVLTACALMRYQFAQGKMPNALSDLVPDYLAEVPLDPFTKRPLGYRVSDGDDCIFGEPYQEPLGESDPTAEGPIMKGEAAGGSGPIDGATPNFMDFPPRPDRVIIPLQAGQAVIWSIGEDGSDEQGRRLLWMESNQRLPGDVIWVIPLVKKR